MQIFVFGSNRQGRHGRGAALDAVENWGAVYGRARGLQGNSYAIVTKELRAGHPPVDLEEIREEVNTLLNFAAQFPELEFIVSPIGCGLAGFRPWQIAPMFKNRTPNVKLPRLFLQELECES